MKERKTKQMETWTGCASFNSIYDMLGDLGRVFEGIWKVFGRYLEGFGDICGGYLDVFLEHV